MSRKEDILYAALELASANGMKGVSMSQIAGRVGIKAPSLYNHFGSKDEIIREMYGFLRAQALKNNRRTPIDYARLLKENTSEEVLTGALAAYIGMISDEHMMQFFRILYSERSTNPAAAALVLEETEHMIAQTKELFYALAVHGKIAKDHADMAATTYALTIHSMIDNRMDRVTAGKLESFGSGIPAEMASFIKWFARLIEGSDKS